MKLFHWLVTAPIALVLVVFAVSNRAVATITLWPFPIEIDAPVYLVVLLTLLAGFLIGLLVAWIASLKTRRELRLQKKRAVALEAEIQGLRANPVIPAPLVNPPPVNLGSRLPGP